MAVLLYTDGLTEARHDGELFGLEGVSAVLGKNKNPSPSEAIAVLRARVRRFCIRHLDRRPLLAGFALVLLGRGSRARPSPAVASTSTAARRRTPRGQHGGEGMDGMTAAPRRSAGWRSAKAD